MIGRLGPGDSLSPLWQELAKDAAQPETWLSLATSYARTNLPWQAKYAARQAIRLDGTLRSRLHALDDTLGQDTSVGDALLSQATLPQAPVWITRFRAAVESTPGDWLTWLYLARLLEMEASLDAQHALEQARQLEPLPGETLHWMGVWRLNAGNAAAAVDALAGLLDIRPLRHGSMMYLGEALLHVGKAAAAEKAFSRASLSDSVAFLLLLSARVYGHNYWQEAIAILGKALALQPDHVAAWLALARIQSEVYALADCRESLRRVHALDPNNAEAHLLEAGLRGRYGDAKGHLAMLRGAYDSGGDPRSRLASSVAMTSLYEEELAPAEVAELHRRLCAPIEAAVARQSEFTNTRDPQRRLRVGFVTGDLHRQHPVNLFMLPLLLRLDRASFDLCVYHTGGMHDEYTRRARERADRWLEAAGLDDPSLQQCVAADGVDILVDLAGHTSSHRLGVFAMRAAPVQATFLGYPHSTGLSTIDWLIGDATVSPVEHADLFSEGLAQLPDSVFCWAPVDGYPLPPPRPAEAPVTFGSFNNAMKLSPRTVALWSRILGEVPAATLLLKAPSFRDESVQARYRELFAAHGVAPTRLAFRGPTGLDSMMQEYGDLDIALDPLPYNGGTTSLQALWMGVPVVSLTGGNFASRMGSSFLRTLGYPEWVARDEREYVLAAVRLAECATEWRRGRAALRQRMRASPLCDIEAYVRHFEELLRRMWLAHCVGDGRRVIGIDDGGRSKHDSGR